jgi:hypothetical protein
LKRRPKSPRSARKQIVADDLKENLLAFLQARFYKGHPVAFAKDRPRLLQWVVLWPAKWLDDKAVTLPPERYREILMEVFQDGLRFGDLERITYLPAWLAKVVQSHFRHHGDEIYDEAKSIRTLADHALAVAGRLETRAADPVRELAAAARLLQVKKPSKKPANNDQLNLL